MSHDMIDDLALIAHPHPRHGEVAPPEFFDDAAIEAAQRRAEYAENLRTLLEATNEDPLLAALRTTAGRRDEAAAHVRALLAYGRHCTGGQRPGYSWQTLADAAGLAYATARRQISDAEVAEVRATVQTPAQEQPQATPKHAVTIELDEDNLFVLTEALQDFAARQRADDEEARRATWAATAETLLDHIEAALSPKEER